MSPGLANFRRSIAIQVMIDSKVNVRETSRAYRQQRYDDCRRLEHELRGMLRTFGPIECGGMVYEALPSPWTPYNPAWGLA